MRLLHNWSLRGSALLLGLMLLLPGAALPAPQKAPAAAPQTAANWVGTYSYEEIGPRTGQGEGPTMVRRYDLRIFRRGGQLLADLDVDGYQTHWLIRAIARPKGQQLRLIFDRPREDNMGNLYQKGDHLLTLERTQRGGKQVLRTHWKKMGLEFGSPDPQLVYFKKDR